MHEAPKKCNLSAYPQFEDWKVKICNEIYERASNSGIEPNWAVAVAIAESGLDPQAVGDGGCSKGLYQWNECVRGKVPQDLIGAYLDEIGGNLERGWNIERAVVRWNWPAKAEAGSWKTSYYYKVLRHYNNLTK